MFIHTCNKTGKQYINRPYTFLMEPNEEQEKVLLHYADTVRYLYNLGLEQRNCCYLPSPVPTLLGIHQRRQANKLAGNKPTGKAPQQNSNTRQIFHKGINYKFQSSQMTVLRKHVDWMQDVPFCVKQEGLRSLDTAFKNFYDRVKKGQGVSKGRNPFGYSVFHGKYHPKTISFPPGALAIKKVSEKAGGEKGAYFSELRVRSAKGSKKIGHIKFRQDRPIQGELKSGNIRRQADGKWYVTFLVKQWHTPPSPGAIPTGEVGIDLGVTQWIALSDRTAYPNTDKQQKTFVSLLKKREKLRKLQSRLDKRKPDRGSNNHKKERERIAKRMYRTVQAMTSLLHEVTHEITSKYGRIGVENLNIKGMTASASGTVEEPGTNVAQKTGRNREIHNRNWGKFLSYLGYKAEERGVRLDRVNPMYTSQTCPKCGHVESANRDEKKFKCLKCGHEDDADFNAAINILIRALSM